MAAATPISDKTIGRLSLYRRKLSALAEEGVENVFSHQLSRLTGNSPAQIRRDVMTIGFSGSPTRGYSVRDLADSIDAFLDAPEGTAVALVGVGNLGRALLSYFAGRRPRLSIVAAFDNDPQRVDRMIAGVPCYPDGAMAEVVARKSIGVAILTVPAGEAQAVAERLVAAGVSGLLNFAPTPLRLPPEIYVEDVDITMLLEKAAYFARHTDV